MNHLAAWAWAVWLAVPAVVTLLAALWLWWRGRPRRPPTTRESIAAHRAYLDALARASAAEEGDSRSG